MEMRRVLHLKGGDDHASYAKNSSFQRPTNFFRANRPATGCISLTDLGCASGPNTLSAIQDIIENIDRECHDSNIYPELPRILVFLNDLASNDFNSIFQLLPSFNEKT
ncbi:unnamed protein product [Coffea canephora]|uniref:Uncharacterized protein n=1 Tax=Coffea canephora TaxID=49390 RepID=A0A068VA39_COFCA|nr:unnamed protein product [Coffea canephora]